MKAIYLDNHASTPVDPRVRDAMLPWLGALFGNAGSKAHAYGWQAAEVVERARVHVAELVGAKPKEVVFTSGATEADNIAILGLLAGQSDGRIVTTAIEHHAVLDTCMALHARGLEVVVLPVDSQGRVRVEDVAATVDARTRLVSVMAANNEVGTLQPIAEIGRLCRERGVPFHCDAAQAVGRIPVDVEAWGVDMLALAGHKFHAPQGVGALVVRGLGRRIRLQPLMHGGGQEAGVRPGTLNVPGIVALGEAARCALSDLESDRARVAALRDRLQERLVGVGGATVHGHPTERLAGNLSIRFEGVEAEALMLAVPQVAFSTGAACSSGDRAPSPILLAIGLSPEQARGTIRLGLGRFTTQAEVDSAGESLAEAVRAIRAGVAVPPRRSG